MTYRSATPDPKLSLLPPGLRRWLVSTLVHPLRTAEVEAKTAHGAKLKGATIVREAPERCHVLMRNGKGR